MPSSLLPKQTLTILQDTPWDPLPAGTAPAFNLRNIKIESSFSSSSQCSSTPRTPPRSLSPSHSLSSSRFSSPPRTPSRSLSPSHSLLSSRSLSYVSIPDPPSLTPSSPSVTDEAFLVDDETTSLIIPFPLSPGPPPNTPDTTLQMETEPTPSVFRRCWSWVKSWFVG